MIRRLPRCAEVRSRFLIAHTPKLQFIEEHASRHSLVSPGWQLAAEQIYLVALSRARIDSSLRCHPTFQSRIEPPREVSTASSSS